jgi:hypothetical protein
VIKRRRLVAVLALLALAAIALLAFGVLGASSSSPRRSAHPAERRKLAVHKSAGPASPRCTPSTLNRSAVLPGTPLSVSPLPDTRVAEPSSQISLLGVPAAQLSDVSVSGSRSGPHAGRLLGYSQGDGASFVPERPFSDGERVAVQGAMQVAGASRRFAFAFTVAEEDPLPHHTAKYAAAATPNGVQRFHSRPDLKAPTVHVNTAATSAVAPGDIFVAAYASGNGPGGPMIFKNSGQLVWFKALAPKVSAADLQLQRYEGRPVLTWWQGNVLPQGFGEGVEVIENAAYQRVAVVHAGNGLYADLHDFQISSRDTGLLTAFDPLHCDLRSIGAPRDGAITDAVFQELDLKTGLVRREWHALDHVAIADSYPKASAGDARTAFPFDFFHINTLDPLTDGSMLISSRNTWTIYRLDQRSGKVLTRIGGKQSTVQMGPGTATAWQHDARAQPDGDITVFDNGAIPKVHKYSRGIRERLDAATNTIKLLDTYSHSPQLSAGTQGNVQILPNGDALLGWGAEPYVSEYSSSGQQIFDASMPPASQSYRAFRFPWSAQPASSPVLAIATGRTGGSRLAYASWNGATQVASWRLLAGHTPSELAQAGNTPASGFETTIPITRPGPWFEVQALDAAGAVLGSSSAASAKH